MATASIFLHMATPRDAQPDKQSRRRAFRLALLGRVKHCHKVIKRLADKQPITTILKKKPVDGIKIQVCFYLLDIRNLTLMTISSGTRFEHSTVQDKSPISLCSERFERDYCDYNIDTLLVPNEKVGILGLCCQVLAEAYANATGCRSRCHTMLEIPNVQMQCLTEGRIGKMRHTPNFLPLRGPRCVEGGLEKSGGPGNSRLTNAGRIKGYVKSRHAGIIKSENKTREGN
ncbi:hypothetical protein BKA57DRAFT_231015 [Linnemannia elongata]|nr:hypothetical protein BKA57DRAFT_231015 [Linnemannia elongata]